MAKRVKLVKRPWPYELHDEVADLVRKLEESGPRASTGLPMMGDAPLWDMVYAQLLLSVRLYQIAKLADKLDEVERTQMAAFAKLVRDEGEMIARTMLDIFKTTNRASVNITKTTGGWYFVDAIPESRSKSLAASLEAAGKVKRKMRAVRD